VVALLVVSWSRELDYAHVPRVELRDQALDRPSLAGGILALEDHADRGPKLPAPDQAAEREPQLGQPGPGALEPILLLLAGEPLGQVEVVENAHG
jgi:hypothetical protein